MIKIFIFYGLCLSLFLLASCNDNEFPNKKDTLFELMAKDKTGISFANMLKYDEEFNVYTYRNYYNGGGVAIGDINNDGLSDIYFTSNLESNKLYLNKGNFQFEDISDQAGIGGTRSWSTGVNMVDVNADGLLDIYVCNSGDIQEDDKQNELFINNGNLTFTERAEEFGLADKGLSTHSAFFDYDKDGDLDAYIVNNSFRAIGSFNLKKNEREVRDSINGDRLYENRNGHFEDVSAPAGIYGSTIGFGLGVMVTDLDRDGWHDIYVCNDFFERDYIYMNNTDGTFREELIDQMPSISMASMGIDAADMNNDGYPDLFVTEMLPKIEERLKTSMSFENWNNYQSKIRNGYHNQFTRNMFHLNNGLDKKNNLSFSEISRQEEVHATDWSWSVLMADLDLDGFKDIYISNGVYQDILNQDYLNYISNEVVARSMITEHGVNFKKLIDIIPSKPISNVAYSGNKDFSFKDSTTAWGLEHPGFSNGMAYGDLDNDGDLDLVVNNVNMNAFVYQNHTDTLYPNRKFLKIRLKGEGKNTFAIGAKVTLAHQGSHQIMEQIPSRGFQSSVDQTLTFGTGSEGTIDTVLVQWPSGKSSVLSNVSTDQILTIDESVAKIEFKNENSNKGLIRGFAFQDVLGTFTEELIHQENRFSDFDKDAMVFQMSSTEGPKMAIADVNGDGLEDVFLCGAMGSPGQLLIQTKDGNLTAIANREFEKDKRSEDVDALFFDADQDGDQDLYVVSGGNEFPSSSSALSDRMYFNNGKGVFTKSPQMLPTTTFESTSCVKINDFDNDGDLDLFVGVRLKDRNYGIPQNGYLLENDGKGLFKNVSDKLAPGLRDLGMIKDAIWTDFNNDHKNDLIIVGEWMPIQLFENTESGFKNVTDQKGLSDYSGWWNTIKAVDLDNDGDQDYILGNHGLNSRFKASKDQPISCYINDFDQNGTIEQIICTYNDDVSYPLALRHDLTAQLPYLKKRFLKYEDYQRKEISDIFDEEQLKSSLKHTASFLQSAILWNGDNEKFTLSPLPKEAQISPIYAIYTQDMNGDGFEDILLGGNLFEVKPEIGRYDASYGVCLLNNQNRGFDAVPNREIGLRIDGQVRDIKAITLNQRNILLIARNNANVQIIELVSDTKNLIGKN